ncbi:MAG TPA: long-chain-fatty-acid--CoA ligase [Ilumatobacteraceae bacterium]|nr:long-chain-fatty-acid--CoA ligase [Ilumatobacteraceae bacterium]
MLLSDVLRRAGHKFTDRPAVVTTTRSMTYGELRDDANRLANALRAVAAPGDRIAILAENIPEYVVCYYGVPTAGMALTFLNYRLHPREWVWILNNAGATGLVVQAAFYDALAPHLGELATTPHVWIVPDDAGSRAGHPTFDDLLAGGAADEPPRDADEDDTAWLIYTSGTTGFPKGAMLTHRSILEAVKATMVEAEPTDRDRSLLAFPLCHVAGYGVPAMNLRGGTIVVPTSFEPEQWMALVDEHEITSTAVAPTMLQMILQHPKIDDYSLRSLRSIGYGAAAMPVEVLRRAIERFGPSVASGFGMTELSGNVLTFKKEAHVRAVNGEEHLLASCGVPMALADVMVVDDDFVECPPGQVGEIVVRGDQVLKGYFGNPEATAAAFHGEWFKTGDMARRDEEGFFYIVDRKKDMIITGGENVYSREVEEALYLHPGVAEAAVIGIPDETWGENVTAVIVARAGTTITEAEIVATVRDRLAGYKKPKAVHFIDEMPKTVSGKILKRELRDRFTPR